MIDNDGITLFTSALRKVATQVSFSFTAKKHNLFMKRIIVSLETKMHIVLTAQDIISHLCLLHVRALTLLQCRALSDDDF